MGRIIGGILAGIVSAFAAIWLIEFVGHSVYPVRSDVNQGNVEEMASLIRGMPVGAQAFVVLAWLVGAMAGGVVANSIANRRWPAWPVAALVAAASILNILMIPHPEWMQIGAVVAPVLGGLLATHLAKGAPSGPATTSTGAANAEQI
ncbi:MAG TPA: hypothetical protein VK391_03080 [Allosphingosinicella sp.]|nr:hypothetical protein [Allosphingosinicella sp.]